MSMAIIEQLPLAVPASPFAEIGAFAAPLVVIVGIGWAVQWLEDRFESSVTEIVNPPMSSAFVSPRREYVLGPQLAVGDASVVYPAVGDDLEWVLKIARSARSGQLLLKEYRVLRELADLSDGSPYPHYFPTVEETFCISRRRINVYFWREGLFTGEEIRRRFPGGLDGRHLAWMFNCTLEAIGFAHSNGWIHGAVLPPHLMFHADDHGLQLVGWIHAERPGRRLRTAALRYRHWYPSECHRRRPATPATDIYLAAKSMIWLAGGDPLTNAIPDHIPVEIRQFLQSCVLASAGMRPQDAWELREEFTDLLEGVYGPPKFHVLEMQGESHGYHTLV